MISAAPAFAAFLLDLPGPQFLTLYFFLALFALTGLAIYRSTVDPLDRETLPPLPEKLDARELAWLRGGTEELVRLSGLDLLQRGYVRQNGARLEEHPTPPPKRNLPKPLLSMLEIVKDAPGARDLLRRTGVVFGEEAAEYEERAREAGLLTAGGVQAKMNQAAGIVAVVLLGLGGLKIMVALSRGRHNIGFLIVLMIFVAVLTLVIRKLPRLSARGRAYIERAQTALHHLKARVPSMGERDPALILAVGAYGLGVLAPTPYADYHRYYVPSGTSSSGSSCGSGCSSSSSSSGGGGSGCGGGCGSGCGGCGGGGGD